MQIAWMWLRMGLVLGLDPSDSIKVEKFLNIFRIFKLEAYSLMKAIGVSTIFFFLVAITTLFVHDSHIHVHLYFCLRIILNWMSMK
jgi:hypothetical protein